MTTTLNDAFVFRQVSALSPSSSGGEKCCLEMGWPLMSPTLECDAAMPVKANNNTVQKMQ